MRPPAIPSPFRHAVRGAGSPTPPAARPLLLAGVFGAILACAAALAQAPGKPGTIAPSAAADPSVTPVPSPGNPTVWAADLITATLGEGSGNKLSLSSDQPTSVVVRIKINHPEKIPLNDQWQLSLTDHTDLAGAADSPGITFENPVFVGRRSTEFFWRFSAKAKSTPPDKGAARLLLVELKQDGTLFTKFLLEYTVAPKVAPALKITTATNWAFDWDVEDDSRLLLLTVDNTDGPATRLRVLKTLLRSDDGCVLDENCFQFSAQPDGGFGKEIPIASGKKNLIYLRVTAPPDDRNPHGKLTGSVKLGAGDGSLYELPTALQAGSSFARWTGAVLAAFGLVLAAALAGYLRPMLTRTLALRPVAVVAEALAKFSNSLPLPPAGAADPVARIRAKVADLRGLIGEEKLDLDNLLPRGFSWVGDTDSIFNSTALIARLDGISGQLAGLRVLAASIHAIPSSDPGLVAKIPQIDALADQSLDAPAAQSRVNIILNTSPFGGGPALREVERIDFTIKVGAGLTWVAWGVVSLGIGAVWIFSQPGFGTLPQLMGCFLWGFGTAALGAKIDSFQPSAIASILKIKLP